MFVHFVYRCSAVNEICTYCVVCVGIECKKVDLALVTSIPPSTTAWAYTRGFMKRLINSYFNIGPDNIRVRYDTIR